MSKAAENALDIIECVVESDAHLGLMGIAGQTGLDKSTTLRALNMLVCRRWLERNESDRTYSPGPRLVSLSATVLSRSDLRTAAAKHIQALRDLTGETVSLHLRVGDERLCIDGLESLYDVRRILSLNAHYPLYEGPSGKVILAHLPSAEQERILSRAPDDIDTSAVRSQLHKIVEIGGMMSVGDRSQGVGAASCPIFGSLGVIASITVAGPDNRWSWAAIQEQFEHIRRTAEQITEAVGGNTL